ncbi:hypothetical protein [Mycobacteroides abscessus]|uniref:hypothetical protein n=1 Tax=Mycobacteroides abscessus TaxID=36809 RepID=UPI002330B273|nr:hypothetical protein [Mycobacteroides abscessus]MDB2196300.1 hypothetical protein [Mycobacteroides abscessus subsp. abscessus]MDB2199895.1 hypothetical protein [Mycobacteroides abscessus subsp. abscessus]
MSNWTRGDTWGGRACYRREVGGDRIMAYVAYDLPWDDEEGSAVYEWSVQDGSRGRILDQGFIDASEGLAGAQRAADEAALRLFPSI